MTASRDDLAGLRRANAELQRQLDERTAELKLRTAERDDALAREAATAEMLGVINSSRDLAPVFEAMLETAMLLCGADLAWFFSYLDGKFAVAAARGLKPEFAEYLSGIDEPGPGSILARMLAGEEFNHEADMKDSDAYRSGRPLRRAIVDLGEARTGLAIPLRRDDQLLGTFNLGRYEVRPFSGKQIALLQNFAGQAVIAMENARLLTETREALEQQTATAEVLGVINSSPGDLAPVFDAMLEKALHLCEADLGGLYRFDGNAVHPVAARSGSKVAADILQQSFVIEPGSSVERLVLCEHRGEVA